MDREDRRRADGTSLEPGSPEYAEYAADHAGIDERDQDRVKRGQATWQQACDDSHPAPEPAGQDAPVQTRQEAIDALRRRQRNRAIKQRQAPRLQAIGQAQADATARADDDHAARHDLPAYLRQRADDDQVETDDIGPGWRTLNKYC